MDIQGRVIKVLEPREGTSSSTGKKWKVCSYVIETNEQYPKRVVFEVFGEDKISSMDIKENELLNVSFDIDAREYNGKWYNSIRAWKVDREITAPVSTPQNESSTFIDPLPVFESTEDDSVLPF